MPEVQERGLRMEKAENGVTADDEGDTLDGEHEPNNSDGYMLYILKVFHTGSRAKQSPANNRRTRTKNLQETGQSSHRIVKATRIATVATVGVPHAERWSTVVVTVCAKWPKVEKCHEMDMMIIVINEKVPSGSLDWQWDIGWDGSTRHQIRA